MFLENYKHFVILYFFRYDNYFWFNNFCKCTIPTDMNNVTNKLLVGIY